DQYFGTPFWTPDGSAFWMQWMNRGQDNLQFYAVNPASGAKTELYDEKQKTWVDWYENVEFLKDNKHFMVQSERDGWSHLYLHTIDGKLKNAITTGKFAVKDIAWTDEKGQTVYFTTRKDNSTRYDLYKVKFDGKGLQRLTFGDFTHDVKISPNGSYFLTTYSNVQTPPKLALVDKAGKVVRELADAKGPTFATTEFAPTELVRVKTSDGFELPVRITWPTNLDPTKKYSVLISIYGGPNAGTVYDGWRWNGQNQWWAKEGLIQVSCDHRGSGHFGKEGQNYLHRNLGKWEIADYSEVVKWLCGKPFVDSSKIAITGFSYGGYTTCLALTAGANYFTHGLAGGSVTSWELYDSHYTERFMDTPAENPEGYKAGSVLTHLDKYRGLLRLVHGTGDDNVHLQNSLQLADKLEDAGKHFEMMFYPGGKHGWTGPKWQHFQTENNRFIYQNLLGKPLAKEMQ
ncbi:MAG: prolyl oligopeptidase family serine peptidase, partial [Sphingobacteriaceae bacterium]|nr:prolyl oligopeptidase family serine peptidase [Cytophagaceae bacterium]